MGLVPTTIYYIIFTQLPWRVQYVSTTGIDCTVQRVRPDLDDGNPNVRAKVTNSETGYFRHQPFQIPDTI